jgi:hypothetical protein
MSVFVKPCIRLSNTEIGLSTNVYMETILKCSHLKQPSRGYVTKLYERNIHMNSMLAGILDLENPESKGFGPLYVKANFSRFTSL